MIRVIPGGNQIRYDIFGEDVTITNALCVETRSGAIIVSEITRYWIEKEAPGVYNFEFQTIIDLYYKVIEGFLVHEREESVNTAMSSRGLVHSLEFLQDTR